MTDRIQYLTVSLEHDVRVDDVEWITNAIRMIKGVKVVENGKPVDMEDWSARMRIGSEFETAIYETLKKLRGDS